MQIRPAQPVLIAIDTAFGHTTVLLRRSELARCSTASEAHICLSAGSHRALLAKSVAEAVAQSLGISAGSLQAKINAIHDAGPISLAMKEAAHEIGCQCDEAPMAILLPTC